MLELTKGSSLSQSDVSINILLNQPEFTRVSPQLEVPSNQQPIKAIISESTAQTTENPLPTTSYPEPIITSGVDQNKICSELSTLDGPAGLSIGVKPLYSRIACLSTTNTHVSRIKCQEVASSSVADNIGNDRPLFSNKYQLFK